MSKAGGIVDSWTTITEISGESDVSGICVSEVGECLSSCSSPRVLHDDREMFRISGQPGIFTPYFLHYPRNGSEEFDAKAVILVDTRSAITVISAIVFDGAKRHLAAGGPDEK